MIFKSHQKKKQLPTIKVINSETKYFEGVRRYNPNFVESVVKEIRALPKGVLINLFATTHAQHNYEIAKQSLTLADRGNVDIEYLYISKKRIKIENLSKNIKLYNLISTSFP